MNDKLFTVAVAGGKGGVGKSVVSANLAVALAQRREQQGGWVLAVDLDVGCGNLNWCLGVADAPENINHFLRGEVPHLKDLIRTTEQPKLSVICSSYTGVPPAELTPENRRRLKEQLPRLGAECLVLDLGAGTSDEVLDLFLGAKEKIIVVNPDPLSLQNAFVFIKITILRFLEGELAREEFLAPVRSTLTRVIQEQENLDVRQLIDELKQWDRMAAYVLAGFVDDLRLRLVVNMYQHDEDEKSYLQSFHSTLFRDLCLRNNLSYLGFVHADPNVKKALQGTSPLLHRFPDSPASRDIQTIAQRLTEGIELDNIPQLHFPGDDQAVRRPFWKR